MIENYVFNVIDDCNYKALAIDTGLSYPARAVLKTLDNLEELSMSKVITAQSLSPKRLWAGAKRTL
jgi:hypothetical protein